MNVPVANLSVIKFYLFFHKLNLTIKKLPGDI